MAQPPFPISSDDMNPRLLEALASLNQISTAINQIGISEDQSSSLQLIVESAIRVVPGFSASIYTYDPLTNSLDAQTRVVAYAEGYESQNINPSEDIPRSNGFGIRSIQRKRRTFSYEETDLQIHPYQKKLGVKAVAAFPLTIADDVLGVLYIYLYEDRKLSQFEELMLHNFVNQAAMAIFHARHLTGIKQNLAQKENELTRLRRAGMLISSRQKLEETLESILELALELTNAQYGIFRLLDKSGESLVTRAVSSVQLERPLVEKLPIDGKSVMAHVARTRQPLLIRDLREKQWAEVYYPLDSTLEMRSELCVPLINASGRLEGVLNLESPRIGGFSEDDSHMLQSLATYAVTAIQEVRLLDALQEAAQLLISQPSNIVLDHLCAMANDLLNTASSAIWLKNETGIMELIASNGTETSKEVPISSKDSNVLLIPLLSGEEDTALGTFGAFHPAAGEVRSDTSEWDKKVLACLANYAVLAVQNESRQQALRSSQEQHLIAETFAAVGDISANLLHNMNNKVGVIPVRVQGIQDKYEKLLGDDAYLAKSLSEIERSAAAAMQIVQENLSHLRPLRMERIQIAPRVTDAVRAVAAPADIQIEVNGLEQLPMVHASGQSLSFVFRNLIENAVDAMQGKGKITINGKQNLHWVEIEVSDTGRGIPSELHEQIFELEHSSRTHPGKMGFGLWWVKTLMTRLGGSVTVDSDGAHGTTFHLRFPIAEQA
ncbi:MAG: GAF domain-containing protein [Anaerolineales bacterium]|uniref:GAF domain-containing protein n=1 Tax=Candidatus Villigracilis vicinus TaxID=3140679 RepID=UPI0031373B36|nr:GAF domain-containing protein [Anaerolineales bacterium]